MNNVVSFKQASGGELPPDQPCPVCGRVVQAPIKRIGQRLVFGLFCAVSIASLAAYAAVGGWMAYTATLGPIQGFFGVMEFIVASGFVASLIMALYGKSPPLFQPRPSQWVHHTHDPQEVIIRENRR